MAKPAHLNVGLEHQDVNNHKAPDDNRHNVGANNHEAEIMLNARRQQVWPSDPIKPMISENMM